jgi:hypothetical protein
VAQKTITTSIIMRHAFECISILLFFVNALLFFYKTLSSHRSISNSTLFMGHLDPMMCKMIPKTEPAIAVTGSSQLVLLLERRNCTISKTIEIAQTIKNAQIKYFFISVLIDRNLLIDGVSIGKLKLCVNNNLFCHNIW